MTAFYKNGKVNILAANYNLLFVGVFVGTGTHIATGWLDIGVKDEVVGIRFF